MWNVESRIGQLASELNTRQIGKIPSDTQVPKMEDGKEYKVVELRSEKELTWSLQGTWISK